MAILFPIKYSTYDCFRIEVFLPDSAVSEKKKESRKSLIFRILPRFAFAMGGPTWIGGLALMKYHRIATF